ncbi:MAG: Prephenate dehydrogenase [Clostridiales bacterium]|jgi:prephenate dehydrogenase|nr:Prephenate dehydrogenase [Clostridiales bacterium]
MLELEIMNQKFKKVVIIGLGLIGGSIGLALKRRDFAREIVGIDKDSNILQKALELGAIDKAVDDASVDLRGAELMILAVHLDAIERVLKKVAPFIPKGCIVTDVTSVKEKAIEIIENMLPKDVYFIGGHPMAGSERGGIEAADPFLFENAIYVLTPGKNNSGGIVDTMKTFIKTLGAKPLILDPKRHDFLVALISHMPHIVAASLNLTVAELDRSNEALALAAGGFRDTTRIASSHPEMWSSICTGNSVELSRVLTAIRDVLARFQQLIEHGEQDQLKNCLEEAKRIRDSLPDRPGLLPRVFEIIVTLPDRPGEIGRIGTLLGDNGINISEIEILRVREGDGGTMRLAFSCEEDEVKAQKILQEAGYKARRRV